MLTSHPLSGKSQENGEILRNRCLCADIVPTYVYSLGFCDVCVCVCVHVCVCVCVCVRVCVCVCMVCGAETNSEWLRTLWFLCTFVGLGVALAK